MVTTSKCIVSLAFLACSYGWAGSPTKPGRLAEELQTVTAEIGHFGGRLSVAERAEPKTFNPLIAADAPSREIIQLINADLIHIDRQSQKTGPALAKSWTASPGGRHYILKLRAGLRFSDGQPFDADDVVFTFQAYLDEKNHSPQRDLLMIGGKPLKVAKIDAHTVSFELAQPYAAAERIFDSLAILPRHLLEREGREGKLAEVWGLNTPPGRMAGLGPFRLKQYVPGQHVILERNPFYWKQDQARHRLPYLDEIDFAFVASEDAQAIRFEAGESDMINGLNSQNFAVLERSQHGRDNRLYDLGPGLEFNFLFFNLNDLSSSALPGVAREQAWFRELKFRQAISAAIDREAIVRLVYRGRGIPLWGPATPANKMWVNDKLPHPARSLERARELLKAAGFSWRDNALVDAAGQPVDFSIVSSASNTQRIQMATLIQDDLSQLGIHVHVVPLEFRALLDRVFHTHDYEGCVLGLTSGDVDPNPEMNVWLSSGGTHLWNTGEPKPATSWEAEIDRLMREQLITLDVSKRKRLYDRVQQVLAEEIPLIYLASPSILVGAKSSLRNFRPAILDHYTLWNAEELYWGPPEWSMKR